MKIRIWLTIVVFMLFSFGISQVSMGESEIAVFKNSLKDFKKLKNKSNSFNDNLRAANKSYKKAKTDEEKASALTEIAGIRMERVKAKDAAIRALRKAITHFSGINEIIDEKGLKNGYKAGRLGDIDDILKGLKHDFSVEEDMNFLNPKENEAINAASEAMLKEAEKIAAVCSKVVKKLEGSPEIRGNGNKALVQNWRKQFAVLEKGLKGNLAAEKMTAHAILKLSETYNVKNAVKEIFSDIYGDMSFGNLLAQTKKERLASFGVLGQVIEDLNNTGNMVFEPDEIVDDVRDAEMIPDNCDVKDDEITYCFFDPEEGEGRWYTTKSGVDDDSVRIKAPFDYAVNDGTYVRYENGQWYSFHPSYNNKAVEIYSDADLAEPESADNEQG